MKKVLFTGSAIAIITPFDEDNKINFKKLGEIIDHQIENGTDGIVICGTTGEASTLSEEEHVECIRVAAARAKKAAKKVPIFSCSRIRKSRVRFRDDRQIRV